MRVKNYSTNYLDFSTRTCVGLSGKRHHSKIIEEMTSSSLSRASEIKMKPI